MVKVYTEKDLDCNVLEDACVAVIGYGSQGRAHALNLRDSGIQTVLGLRPGGSTWFKAINDGWDPLPVEQAVQVADAVVMLVPDMAQKRLFEDCIEPNLKSDATLLFAHGFNIHFSHIHPSENMDVIMVAPKSPGHLVRRQYEEGKGVPCLAAVHQNHSGLAFEKALSYAHCLGGTRAGVLETTFAEETETDLFGEQAVLCGGVTELITAGFETLVEAGYQPEIAYFECLHEMKLIVDLIYEGGFEKMHEFVSETAIYGDLSRGPRIIDAHVKANMKTILREVQDGTFAKEWAEENRSGLKEYHRLHKQDLEHPLETVGKNLRSRMAWLQKKEKATT